MFVDCDLKNATFDRSVMNNAHFIRSKLESASFAEAFLNNADFEGATIVSVNFTGAFLIRANFLSAEVVQGIIFMNCDLFGAHFTDVQFRGQRVTTMAHVFNHARLPNGTFGSIDEKKNLIRNGDAERNGKKFSLETVNSMLMIIFRLLYLVLSPDAGSLVNTYFQ